MYRSFFCILERKEIGFHARLAAAKVFNRQDIIKFATVDTNEGSRYDANTGKFTAPEEGLYFFTVKVTANPGTYTTWYIKSSKGDTVYAMALASPGNHGTGADTASAVIKLSKGDKVFVYHHDASNNSADKSVRCDTHVCPTFSGYVIN